MKTDTVSDILARRASQVQRGGSRAAVLGYNDGLVSVLCIVIAVAAAGGDTKTVLTAGLAGLLAGAISMAAGEWVSVKAQVELFQGILSDLRLVIKRDRQLLVNNLSARLSELGVGKKDSARAAKDVAESDDNLLTVYSAQVLGVNKDELGSPWYAAVSSFVLFTIGSILPLIAWFVGLDGGKAIVMAIILTIFGGLFVGGFTAHSSGKNIYYGAIRQLIIIVIAAGATYGIGSLFGVAIG
ncbi:MAG: VIT1/CCC1 transporter family protein [bacterium]|nr:VIT1/CCC1 transporter family protein [bacterium]MDN5835556.1 VIT1/CCC1 transporter family protein [bacterium]